MEKQVSIAESRESVRIGLKTLFSKDPYVTSIYEAATSDDLKKQLGTLSPHLVVIHQSLMFDLKYLPKDHFIVLATEPDRKTLFAARIYGARGYVLETIAPTLLQATLMLKPGEFLLDPTLTPWLLAEISLAEQTQSPLQIEILTDREQEVLKLLESGISNHAIAEQLCISKATVKTHVARIYKKLALKGRSTRILSGLGGQEGRRSRTHLQEETRNNDWISAKKSS